MSHPLRIIFMGTPDFAVPTLQTLLNSGHDIVAVYSQPPRPKGRGHKLQASPVQQLAESAEIPVFNPINFKDKNHVRLFEKHKADLAIVAAYGLILPKNILETPTYGCLNIHGSLLPRWRGAAPIQKAIWSGDKETGITIMKMDIGLDTGDMISKKSVPITAQMTTPILHDILAQLGAEMIDDFLENFLKNRKITAQKQPIEGVTYASMLSKNDGRIDWHQSATEIDCQIRALNPWPGTWTLVNNSKRLKIIDCDLTTKKSDFPVGTIIEGGYVSCGNGEVLKLKNIQPENSNKMDVLAAMNGGHININDVLL